MNQQFPHLFAPLKLRQKTLKNRIVFVPHATHLTKNQLPSDGLVLYHRERAKGGVGMTAISGLHEDLKDMIPETYAIGDCVKPRRIMDAIWEGFRIARLI